MKLAGFTFDTNSGEYLRFSDAKSYGLDAIGERRFPQFSGYKLIRIPEVMAAAEEEYLAANPGKKLPAVFRASLSDQEKYIQREKLLHLRHLSLETLRLYNGGDCDLTKRIEVSNKKHIPQALMQLYIDLSFILYQMEPRGPEYDFEQHEKLMLIYPAKVKGLLAKLRKLVKNKEYNPGSAPQVYQALYEVLKLKYPFDGKPNTRKMALLMLGRKHEFPRVQLEWRKVARVASTLKGYHRCALANSGRLRTRWWSTGTRTGRLSSGGSKDKSATVVNLQNIKKDAQVKNLCVADIQWQKFYGAAYAILKSLKYNHILKYWRELKKDKTRKPWNVAEEQLEQFATKLEAWVRENMPDLCTYLCLDYGQVEVRVMAQMSGDKNLIKDCQSGDIHSTVGAVMTGWNVDAIKNDEHVRTLTKNVHFAIMFGKARSGVFEYVVAMSPADMRDRVSQEQVEDAYDRYFERYSRVKLFIQDQREFGKEHRYVETLFGMKQALNVSDDRQEEEDEYIDPDEVGERGAYWGNQAINGPVQGTAHQLMICALVNLIRKPKKYKVLGIPPLEVHDMLGFRVKVLDLIDAYSKAKYLLEQESLNTVASDFPEIKWKVPIVVDAKAGIRLGCQVKVNEKTTIGQFLVDWFRLCRSQMRELDKELEAAAQVTV